MKKETKLNREMSKIILKKGLLDALDDIYSQVENQIKDCTHDYKIIGKESEQSRDRDGNLKWVDDEKTIPYYRDKWGYVEKSLDDLTDERYAKYLGLLEIKEVLESLL